ncbi:hypothetical protein [Sphingomonas desiccabilis]|uniref:Uncharacterized protein n=1 Tax=Sphingomonas desiccabilis TaxID=429134 RepID=A0A4Q2J094_9SPHN|nr:hypothetical protein [Sphingomonas desiccabilis]MBB3912720.1 hypothetical protein [Sphingomonas desiccabilis]RXZ34682.1 hypothetical protein EO081_03145 [Sphingomonas desiccabilis]
MAALTRAPLDQRLLGIWGTAELAREREAEAQTIFAVAGALGWRDRATQRYWALAALQLGDFAVAAQRTDALLRMDGPTPHARLLSALEATPAGRAALADRLVLSPPWASAWIAQAQRGTPALAASRAAVIERAVRASYAAPPAAGGLVRRLFEGGRVADAQRLWGVLEKGQSGTMLANGFGYATTWIKSPFTWALTVNGNVDARIEGTGMEAELIVVSVTATRQTAATHGMALTPGRYALEWNVVAEPDANRPMEATVRCVVENADLTRDAEPKILGTRRRQEFTVPPGCAGQWIAFRVPAAPGSSEHRISQPKLARIS